MTNWDMWHDYRRAVDDGAEPLLHDCTDAGRLYVQADANYDPILHCFMCGRLVRPTYSMVRWVEQQLRENGYRNY